MRYTLLLHYAEQTDESAGAEVIEAGRQAFADYAAILHEAGVLVSAEVLAPSTASTTLRTVGGVVQVQDGPFADSVEQLGGTVVLDVDDLDAALGWARQAPPVAWGAVEVRPGAVHVVDGRWRANA